MWSVLGHIDINVFTFFVKWIFVEALFGLVMFTVSFISIGKHGALHTDSVLIRGLLHDHC